MIWFATLITWLSLEFPNNIQLARNLFPLKKPGKDALILKLKVKNCLEMGKTDSKNKVIFDPTASEQNCLFATLLYVALLWLF